MRRFFILAVALRSAWLVAPVVAALLCGSPARAAEPACAENGNDFTPFRCAEPDAIADASGLVSRRGGVLTLRTDAGTVELTDGDQCGGDGRPFSDENCIGYIFLRHVPEQHAFLILVAYYEGKDYRWIDDRTGQVIKLNGEPHFSPSGNLFAIVEATEAGGFNGLEIWSCHEPAMQWRYVPNEDALFSFVSWTGEDELTLSVLIVRGNQEVEFPARVVHDGSGWRREGPPPG